jgi:hypothetical protein
VRFRARIEPEDTDPWPGPGWEPVVFDGMYPLLSEPGDIYINRHRDPPLCYLFTRKGHCEMVSREELTEWVTGGLMMRPTPVQPRGVQRSRSRSFPVE